jgi:hypothetical protein
MAVGTASLSDFGSDAKFVRANRGAAQQGVRLQRPRCHHGEPAGIPSIRAARWSLRDQVIGVAVSKSSCPLVKKSIEDKSATEPSSIVRLPIVGTSTATPGAFLILPDLRRTAK